MNIFPVNLLLIFVKINSSQYYISFSLLYHHMQPRIMLKFIIAQKIFIYYVCKYPQMINAIRLCFKFIPFLMGPFHARHCMSEEIYKDLHLLYFNMVVLINSFIHLSTYLVS